MRVECGSCKRVTEARFERVAAPETESGAVEVRAICSACGFAQTAPLADKAEPPKALTLDELCPKCGAVRAADADACRSCGLATARMAAFAATRDALAPDDVREAWNALQGDAWSDAARHDAFFLLIARQSAYAWAAGRYRDMTRTHPEDSIAKAQLERLRRAGEATLFASAAQRATKEKTPYGAVFIILGVLILAIIGGVFYALVKDGEAPPPPPSPPNHFQIR